MVAIDRASTDMKRNGSHHNCLSRTGRPSGFTMLEIMVTLVILMLGLLGLIGMQARGQQAEFEAYQRGQGLVLLQDMIDRMNSNRTDSRNQVYVTTSPLGGGGVLADCTGLTGAALDKCEWGNLLKGAAEVSAGGTCDTTSGAKCVGAMLGARGCISYDATTELSDSTGVVLTGTGIQTITVAWQGVNKTAAPPAAVTCGQGLYPDEKMRRTVTATLRMAALRAQ